jgi:sugar lactone lactonase YvrE
MAPAGAALGLSTPRLILAETNGRACTVGIDLLYANGVAITPDRRTLVVAETFAERISAVDNDQSLFVVITEKARRNAS